MTRVVENLGPPEKEKFPITVEADPQEIATETIKLLLSLKEKPESEQTIVRSTPRPLLKNNTREILRAIEDIRFIKDNLLHERKVNIGIAEPRKGGRFEITQPQKESPSFTLQIDGERGKEDLVFQVNLVCPREEQVVSREVLHS